MGEDSTSTDDASGELQRTAKNPNSHSWLDRRAKQAENRRKVQQRGLQNLKQEIQTIIDKQEKWYMQSQEQQYIRHAYEKFGESTATLKASTAALHKMVREFPHDHEFIKVVFEPVPRFGLRRFEGIVAAEIDKKLSESTPESVVEDFKKVFEEHQVIDHSFGPADGKNPKIILPSAQGQQQPPNPTRVQIVQAGEGIKNRLVQQKSNIVSEDLQAGRNRNNFLGVPGRGFSLPGSPNTVTEKSGQGLEKIGANFRSGSKSKVGGSPSSFNSKTAGKTSRGGNSVGRSAKKEGYIESGNQVGGVISISGLQPPCLAPLSKMPTIIGVGLSRTGAKQLKISKLTIDPVSSHSRKALRPDARSN